MEKLWVSEMQISNRSVTPHIFSVDEKGTEKVEIGKMGGRMRVCERCQSC